MTSRKKNDRRYSFIDDPWGWLDLEDDHDPKVDEEGSTTSGRGYHPLLQKQQEKEEVQQEEELLLIYETAEWKRLSYNNNSSSGGGANSHPRGRCSHSLTSIGNSCLLLFGGGYTDDDDDGGVFCHLNDIWLFNGLKSEWKQLEPKQASDGSGSGELPLPRRGHSAEYCSEIDCLIVFGGTRRRTATTDDDDELLLNDLWIFDLNLICWKRILSTSPGVVVWPSPRRGAISFVYKEKFYIFGGDVGGGESRRHRLPFTELEIFEFDLKQVQVQSTTTAAWKQCYISERHLEGCPYPAFRHLFQSSVPTRNIMLAPSMFCKDSGTLFVFGGIHSPNTVSEFVHYFRIKQQQQQHENSENGTTTTTSFEEVCVFPSTREEEEEDDNNVPATAVTPRYFHGGCMFGNKNFIIVGGSGRDGNLSDSHIYNIQTKQWHPIVSSIRPTTDDDDNNNDNNGNGPMMMMMTPRNGLILTQLNDTHAILFGGGVYQENYFDDTYVLKFGTTTTTTRNNNAAAESNSNHQDEEIPDNDNDDGPKEQQQHQLTPVTLLISSSSSSTINNDNESTPPIIIRETAYLEKLSKYSDYFHRMLEGGNFMESKTTMMMTTTSKKEIQLSQVDPTAASICLKYMMMRNDDDDRSGGVLLLLQGLDLEQLDSIYLLADMWGMHSFLRLLEDTIYKEFLLRMMDEEGRGGDETTTMDELDLLEYAKSRGSKYLTKKSLQRLKLRFGTVVPPDYYSHRQVDPILLQEISDYVEKSLL